MRHEIIGFILMEIVVGIVMVVIMKRMVDVSIIQGNIVVVQHIQVYYQNMLHGIMNMKNGNGLSHEVGLRWYLVHIHVIQNMNEVIVVHMYQMDALQYVEH